MVVVQVCPNLDDEECGLIAGAIKFSKTGKLTHANGGSNAEVTMRWRAALEESSTLDEIPICR